MNCMEFIGISKYLYYLFDANRMIFIVQYIMGKKKNTKNVEKRLVYLY